MHISAIGLEIILSTVSFGAAGSAAAFVTYIGAAIVPPGAFQGTEGINS